MNSALPSASVEGEMEWLVTSGEWLETKTQRVEGLEARE
jgi:hypothetical protein